MSKPPPPPLPADNSQRFEPLPLGPAAFAPPVWSTGASDDDEPSRLRKALPWIVVGTIAVVGGLGAWIAIAINEPSKPEKVEAAAEPAQKKARAEKPAAEPEPAHEAKAAEPSAPAQAETAVPADQEKEGTATENAAAAATPDPKATPEEEEKDEKLSKREQEARERRHAARAAKAAAPQLPAAPSRADVLQSMARVQPAIRGCMHGTHATVVADMKIAGATGRVASVNVTGAAGPIGSCIAQAVRKARFPQFSTASISVKYPMKL